MSARGGTADGPGASRRSEAGKPAKVVQSEMLFCVGLPEPFERAGKGMPWGEGFG